MRRGVTDLGMAITFLWMWKRIRTWCTINMEINKATDIKMGATARNRISAATEH